MVELFRPEFYKIMNTALGIIAFILYLLAASRLGVLIYASEDMPNQQAKVQAFIVGAIAGIVPAMQAARQNPVDSLRG